MSEPTFGAAPQKRLSKNKKIALFAVGGIGGLAAIWWWRNRQANSASSATANNTGTTDPNAIDPNTGIPYSQEGYGGVGSTPGMYGGYVPNPSYGGSGSVWQPTNATWATEAEQYLTSLGYNPVTVATALGLYLSGKPLSQNEYDIVTAAIGFEGNPPNGAPAPILAHGGGSGQGGGSGTTITVPHIVGDRDIAARAKIASKGLRYDPDRKGLGLKGASWTVTSQNPEAGHKVKIGSVVSAVLTPHNPQPVNRRIGPVRRGK